MSRWLHTATRRGPGASAAGAGLRGQTSPEPRSSQSTPGNWSPAQCLWSRHPCSPAHAPGNHAAVILIIGLESLLSSQGLCMSGLVVRLTGQYALSTPLCPPASKREAIYYIRISHASQSLKPTPLTDCAKPRTHQAAASLIRLHLEAISLLGMWYKVRLVSCTGLRRRGRAGSWILCAAPAGSGR